MNGRFTSELWQGIGDIYRGILAHLSGPQAMHNASC